MDFWGLLRTVGVVFGGLLIACGVGLKWGLFPVIVETMITEQLMLSPDNTEVWDTWVEPTAQLPVYMKFTFLNVTNPDAIKAGEQPVVEELGPFAYKEVRRKEGITLMEDTITYGSYISYELDESASCDTCTKDTMITVINPALVGVLAMLETLVAEVPPELAAFVPWILDSINREISKEDGENYDDLFNTQTADKLIFEGYRSGVLMAVLKILKDLEVILPDNFELPPIPDLIADGTFAFFKGKNGTSVNGWYKINSGLNDISQYQHILEYNGKTKLPDIWWDNLPKTPSANKSGVHGYCHDLAGTDGTQYPPFVTKDNDLWLFSSDLCRSIYLSYYQDVDMDGVNTLQFRVKPEVLSFSNPDNACFCPNVDQCVQQVEGEDRWDLSQCTHCRNGMLNLMGCQGAPVIISLPHFLDADVEIQNAISGMNPDPSLHTTFLNIEPYTGVALDAHKRIQVNVPLAPNGYITVLRNVREVIFPVVWVDEGATIDEENMDKLKAQLITPFLGVDIGVGFMIGIGAVLILAITFVSLFCVKKKEIIVKA